MQRLLEAERQTHRERERERATAHTYIYRHKERETKREPEREIESRENERTNTKRNNKTGLAEVWSKSRGIWIEDGVVQEISKVDVWGPWLFADPVLSKTLGGLGT